MVLFIIRAEWFHYRVKLPSILCTFTKNFRTCDFISFLTSGYQRLHLVKRHISQCDYLLEFGGLERKRRGTIVLLCHTSPNHKTTEFFFIRCRQRINNDRAFESLHETPFDSESECTDKPIRYIGHHRNAASW